MTWSTISNVSTTFLEAADLPDGYAVVGYEGNDYIINVSFWSEASEASTTWA